MKQKTKRKKETTKEWKKKERKKEKNKERQGTLKFKAKLVFLGIASHVLIGHGPCFDLGHSPISNGYCFLSQSFSRHCPAHIYCG